MKDKSPSVSRLDQSYVLAPDLVAHLGFSRQPAADELTVLREYLTLVGKVLANRARSHPEDFCERCGGRNVVWFAPSPVWNRAVPDDGILCPVCFVEAATKIGLDFVWRLAPEIQEGQACFACSGKGWYLERSGKQTHCFCGASRHDGAPNLCCRTRGLPMTSPDARPPVPPGGTLWAETPRLPTISASTWLGIEQAKKGEGRIVKLAKGSPRKGGKGQKKTTKRLKKRRRRG